jgi:hypothetical protein
MKELLSSAKFLVFGLLIIELVKLIWGSAGASAFATGFICCAAMTFWEAGRSKKEKQE